MFYIFIRITYLKAYRLGNKFILTINYNIITSNRIVK